MAIPAAVDAVLRKNRVAYGVVEIPPVSAGSQCRVARCSILKHEEERLQVLYPADSLLDLEALQTATGQPWRALCSSALQRLCSKLGLRHPPALPLVLGVPVAVDESLLDAQDLVLDAGDGQCLRISGSEFRRLLEDASRGRYTVPLDRLSQGPCDEVEDLADITRAVSHFTQRRIKQRLEETLELPPLPETAQRITQLRVDPYADIKDLTDIVESDPPLAAQVVSWAASPYYAAPGRIKSVHDAIVRVLGFDLVLNLALGLSLGRTLELPKERADGFTPYWEQAVFGAAAVEGLVGAIPPAHRPTIGLAYLSGLLHNLGYLLLAEIFPPQFQAMCRLQEANPQLHHSYIERHLLGVTREQLASWLMRLWSMPEPVCIALRHQNEPGYEGPDSQYPLLVYTAMRLLRRQGIGDAPLEPIPASVYERLHLDPVKAEEAINTVVGAGGELHHIAAGLAA